MGVRLVTQSRAPPPVGLERATSSLSAEEIFLLLQLSPYVARTFSAIKKHPDLEMYVGFQSSMMIPALAHYQLFDHKVIWNLVLDRSLLYTTLLDHAVLHELEHVRRTTDELELGNHLTMKITHNPTQDLCLMLFDAMQGPLQPHTRGDGTDLLSRHREPSALFQMRNQVSDCYVEHTIYYTYPYHRCRQLTYAHVDAQVVGRLTESDIRRRSSADMLAPINAMNSAYFRFLLQDVLDSAGPAYDLTKTEHELAQELYIATARSFQGHTTPESELADLWAQILGFSGQYRWQALSLNRG